MAINMHMEGVDVGDNEDGNITHSNNLSERNRDPKPTDNNSAGPSRGTSKSSKTESDTEGKMFFIKFIENI